MNVEVHGILGHKINLYENFFKTIIHINEPPVRPVYFNRDTYDWICKILRSRTGGQKHFETKMIFEFEGSVLNDFTDIWLKQRLFLL